MTSQLNVDTIVDKAGSGGTNVKVANNAVAVAEGGSATTNVVQGLAKFWVNVSGNQTSINDSFNQSSVSDGGVGQAIFTFTNSFSQNPFDNASGSIAQPNNAGFSRFANQSSASSIGNNVRNTSNSNADHQTMISINGDLA